MHYCQEILKSRKFGIPEKNVIPDFFTKQEET
jgi:hypothetical protein